MRPEVLLPDAVSRLRVWEFQRPDGYVFQCELAESARSWMLMLACNGNVFARRAFDSRPQAEAWADDFLVGLTGDARAQR